MRSKSASCFIRLFSNCYDGDPGNCPPECLLHLMTRQLVVVRNDIPHTLREIHEDFWGMPQLGELNAPFASKHTL